MSHQMLDQPLAGLPLCGNPANTSHAITHSTLPLPPPWNQLLLCIPEDASWQGYTSHEPGLCPWCSRRTLLLVSPVMSFFRLNSFLSHSASPGCFLHRCQFCLYFKVWYLVHQGFFALILIFFKCSIKIILSLITGGLGAPNILHPR